jgi:hypothetical protein
MDDIKARAVSPLDAETQRRAQILYTEEADNMAQAQRWRERAELYDDLAREQRSQRLALIASARYGLVPGDIIEVTQNTYRGPNTFRMIVTGFFVNGDAPDAAPRIIGILVLATGKEGTATKIVYPDSETFTRIVKLDPATAYQPRGKPAPEVTSAEIVTAAMEAITACFGADRAAVSEVRTERGRFTVALGTRRRGESGWVKPWDFGKRRTITREQMLALIKGWQDTAAANQESEKANAAE